MKKTFYIAFGIFAIAAGTAFFLVRPSADPDRSIAWGVTFSQKFAEKFTGVEWRAMYDFILVDLRAKKLRLVAYWDKIEPEEGQYAFGDLDWQMEMARTHGAQVILAVGRKLPRWPECHEPGWIQSEKLEIKNKKLLEYIKAVVGRYKNNSAIAAWQVENEPFLEFGVCPEFDADFLDEEIALVRSLDARPIVVTDSGELSTWHRAAKRADIFGTTMYRQIQNDRFGIVTYPLPAAFFRAKERLVRMFPGSRAKPFVVIELQAEPWMKLQPYESDPDEQLNIFNVEHFREYVDYARRTGFDEYYLWGAEWWYWMKETRSHAEFWEYAKELIRTDAL